MCSSKYNFYNLVFVENFTNHKIRKWKMFQVNASFCNVIESFQFSNSTHIQLRTTVF